MRSPHLFPASPRARRACAAALLLVGLSPALSFAAPSPPPAAKPDLLADIGGFERPGSPTDNLWDGVNSDGALANFTYSANVVTERGNFGGLAMPPCVAFADLNGDGKPDIVSAGPTGFFHFYANSGTPTEPKFTSAELIPIFVSTCFKKREWEWQLHQSEETARFCPRFALADWRGSGLLDMMIGNYFGEVLFLPNSGSVRQAVYRVPQTGIQAMRVPTHDQGRFWGNLFAPVAYNWGGGAGRTLDLILGEGTYSANTIHLLQNVGSGSAPKFTSTKHSYIAYGDGREQLIPTVADYDGDGKPDLIVGDRTGEVGVYLNTGGNDPTVELKRTSTITFGGTSKLPGVVNPHACDYNGDGLFDLLIGLPSGKIAVSLNTGTKTEPKFGPLQDIKGVDRLGRNIKAPTGWRTDTWAQYGDALQYFTVVNAQEDPESKPPEGGNCLKAGFWPAPAQMFPMPDTGIPGTDRHFTLFRELGNLNVGKTHKLTFKVRGAGMEKMRTSFGAYFRGFPGLDKIEKDERGATKHAVTLVEDYMNITANFSAGSSSWGTVEATVVPKWNKQELRDEKTMKVNLYLDFWGSNLGGQIYFDDFHFSEQ